MYFQWGSWWSPSEDFAGGQARDPRLRLSNCGPGPPRLLRPASPGGAWHARWLLHYPRVDGGDLVTEHPCGQGIMSKRTVDLFPLVLNPVGLLSDRSWPVSELVLTSRASWVELWVVSPRGSTILWFIIWWRRVVLQLTVSLSLFSLLRQTGCSSNFFLSLLLDLSGGLLRGLLSLPHHVELSIALRVRL
jgi:hypothetical protein